MPSGPSIIVVSGLPRSGTSMAMRMLEVGGVPILSDGVRRADEDNPRGYFEYEPVKHLHQPGHDVAWLAGARGKAVKIVSFLLTWLPETYDYRVIFMRRDLSEVAASQEVMIGRRGAAEEAGGGDPRAAYAEHLAQVDRFIARRACFTRMDVAYADAVADPRRAAESIAAFLGGGLDAAAMAAAVDPALRRQKNHPGV